MVVIEVVIVVVVAIKKQLTSRSGNSGFKKPLFKSIISWIQSGLDLRKICFIKSLIILPKVYTLHNLKSLYITQGHHILLVVFVVVVVVVVVVIGVVMVVVVTIKKQLIPRSGNSGFKNPF